MPSPHRTLLSSRLTWYVGTPHSAWCHNPQVGPGVHRGHNTKCLFDLAYRKSCSSEYVLLSIANLWCSERASFWKCGDCFPGLPCFLILQSFGLGSSWNPGSCPSSLWLLAWPVRCEVMFGKVCFNRILMGSPAFSCLETSWQNSGLIPAADAFLQFFWLIAFRCLDWTQSTYALAFDR